MFFANFTKCCRSKRVGVLIYYIGKVCFFTGHSEKGYQFQICRTLLFRVSLRSFVHALVHS